VGWPQNFKEASAEGDIQLKYFSYKICTQSIRAVTKKMATRTLGVYRNSLMYGMFGNSAHIWSCLLVGLKEWYCMLMLCMFGLYLVGALSAEVPFVILHQNNGCLHFNTFCVICDILYIENSILCHFCHNLHSDLASPCHIQYTLLSSILLQFAGLMWL